MKPLRDVLNLVSVGFMDLSMSGLYFKTLVSLSLSFHTKIGLVALSKVVYKASCWNSNSFYGGKTKRRLRNKKSISKLLHKMVTPSLLQTMSSLLVTTSNGTILNPRYWKVRLCVVKLKKRY